MNSRFPASGDTVAYRLRLPGPTAIPARVTQAMGRPVIAHRGSEFIALFSAVQERLMRILGRTGARPFIFSSSGIGAMEAAVVNTIGRGSRALICSNGQWGPVFRRLIEQVGGIAEEVTTPWGAPVDLDEVERRLKRGGYAAVFGVHSESSTGSLTDLKALGRIVARTDALLVVDSVSALAGAEMRQDEWGVDVVVSASQKCLMCPPGLGIASVSDKAWKVVAEEGPGPRSYFDFRRFRPLADKGEPTYTAAVSMFYALDEALTMIDEEGLDNALARHTRVNNALRAGAEAMGFRNFPSGLQSPTLVVLRTPAGVDATKLIARLSDGYNMVIAGTRSEEMKAELIRIGTMGAVSDGDVLTDLHQIASAIGDLGGSVDAAAGFKAASAVLAA
jgi:aspartate aminotransferase-like enzyme